MQVTWSNAGCRQGERNRQSLSQMVFNGQKPYAKEGSALFKIQYKAFKEMRIHSAILRSL